MARHDELKGAYKALGKEAGLYDGMMTCSTASGKAVCRAAWGMNKAECDEYLPHALSGIAG